MYHFHEYGPEIYLKLRAEIEVGIWPFAELDLDIALSGGKVKQLQSNQELSDGDLQRKIKVLKESETAFETVFLKTSFKVMKGFER